MNSFRFKSSSSVTVAATVALSIVAFATTTSQSSSSSSSLSYTGVTFVTSFERSPTISIPSLEDILNDSVEDTRHQTSSTGHEGNGGGNSRVNLLTHSSTSRGGGRVDQDENDNTTLVVSPSSTVIDEPPVVSTQSLTGDGVGEESDNSTIVVSQTLLSVVVDSDSVSASSSSSGRQQEGKSSSSSTGPQEHQTSTGGQGQGQSTGQSSSSSSSTGYIVLPLHDSPTKSNTSFTSPPSSSDTHINMYDTIMNTHTSLPLSSAKPSYKFTKHPLAVSPFYAPTLLAKYASRLPTNAWFMNLVLERGDEPVVPLPYSVNVKQLGSEYGLLMSLPSKKVTRELVMCAHQPDFMFTSTVKLQPHQLIAFDELSATLQFTSGQGRMTLPLVRGSPYITAVFTSLTPRLYTIHAILSVNGQTQPGTITKTHKLKVKLNSGQYYVVYTLADVEWKWDVNALTVTSQVDFELVVRVAVLTRDDDTNEPVLDKYAQTYATGGRMSHSVTRENKVAVEYEFDTSPSSGSGELLLMALPHHQSILASDGPQSSSSVQFDSIKGMMRGVVGSVWRMRLDAVTTSFRADRPIASHRVSELRASLKNDTLHAQVNSTIDPYTYGKEASRLARLALIADELTMTSERDSLLNVLKTSLTLWMEGTNADALQYDSVYGGVCSVRGLADKGADYGQGYYNDHHFHYGYVLYAAAVLASFDKSFGSTYTKSLLTIARDYVNPSSADTFYTPTRHFDAYDGHSWASGLYAFGDGRNQESSSESVNAYYAIALLGRALDNARLTQIGTVLMTLELHSVKRYWHTSAADSVYPEPYASNGMVGMVWGTKVVDATWFASGTAYVHGIQLLPFTPVSEHLLEPREWLAQETKVMEDGLAASKPAVTDSWIGFLRGSQAVLNADKAWSDINALKEFDNGNSKTNMQYWTATRAQ